MKTAFFLLSLALLAPQMATAQDWTAKTQPAGASSIKDGALGPPPKLGPLDGP